MTTNARTDGETGLRWYTWQGREYPSVTSIRRLMGLPFKLHQYQLSQVVNRAVEQHDTATAMLTRDRRPRERVLEKNRKAETATWLRAAATEERDRAGTRGTAVHDAIHAGLAPDSVGGEAYAYLCQYYDFLASTKAQVLYSERQVFSMRYGYAGTLDAILLMPDGRILVVDHKTSEGVYLDHVIQCIAYGMADFIGANDIIDAVASQALTQANGLAILHLQPQTWELIEVEPQSELFAAFLGSLAFAKVEAKHPHGIDTLITSKISGGTLVPQLQASLTVLAGKGHNHGPNNP